MTLAEIFKTNCRASAKLCGFNPTLAFSDLTSGIGGKNKNGVIARLSFNDFFIDLYFIENGPLAYAPNTIWLSVGFESVPFLPFSVYDILAFSEIKNYKSYTYPFIYTTEIMVESFGEINDFLKTFIPLMHDITSNGVKKNRLITSQKETINKFIGDDIFQKEIEMLDASVKIREMLIRNYVEGIISHTVLGGVAEFFKGEHQKAIKKLERQKNRTLYEENLLNALKTGELKDYNASPYRNEKYKNYSKVAKKSTYSLGMGGFFKFFIKALLMTPVFFLILGIIYFLLCYIKYNDALFCLNTDLLSFASLLIAGFSIAEAVLFNFPLNSKNLFKKKKAKDVPPVKKPSVVKYITIFTETIVIILLMSSVNNAVVFTENKVYFPENKYISLRQDAMRYEHFQTVYKAQKYYHFGVQELDHPHYILVSKNGEKIDLALYPDNTSEEFEKTILPLFTENGCEIIEIESERDIK
ncbi:MAG: hypothetical protein E7556_02010 [Ruminococcaceae bacterium]|nr:hypothetical protein [Oscillospiraceae bacterium]